MATKRSKVTLATLSALAKNASDDAEASVELREHMCANVEAYAGLFGVSTARFAAWAGEADDPKRYCGFARGVLSTTKEAMKRAREALNVAKDREASYAADAATASASFTEEPGVVELDAELVRASLACHEPRVRIQLASGIPADVDGTMLREILAVRPHARVFVHTTEHPARRVSENDAPWVGCSPVRVRWERGGFRGGMTLRALAPVGPDEVPVRVIHVPDPFAPFAVREEAAVASSVEHVEEVMAAE